MPDDARYARRLADHLGIRLHEIEIHPDIVDMLPRMVDILDEPIGDPAAINTLLMCDAARDAGVKVLLSGMGADELFGGYRKHLAMLVAERYRRMPGAVAPRSPRPCVPSPWRWAAVGCARSAGRSASSPSPSFPSRKPSGAATPSTTATSSPASSTSLAGHVDTVLDRTARSTTTTTSTTS